MNQIRWDNGDDHSAQGTWIFPELEDEANFISLSQTIPGEDML